MNQSEMLREEEFKERAKKAISDGCDFNMM